MVTIDMFTDPGCPIAYSCEPQLQQLRWHYGEQFTLREHMIVIAVDEQHYLDKGYTPETMAAGYAAISARHHMPFDTTPRERVPGTLLACRAVVGARMNHGERAADTLRRQIAIHAFAGGRLLDDVGQLHTSARAAGLDAADIDSWLAAPDVHEQLARDMAAARHPSPAARVLDHKLADWRDDDTGETRRRYSAPSMVCRGRDATITIAGYQPWESVDAAMANADSSLTRRAAPREVTDVLAWTIQPLATAEIAALCDMSLDTTRDALRAAGAHLASAGNDGFWDAA